MNQPTIPRYHPLASWGLALAMAAFPMPNFAHEPGQLTPDPGFRPESDYAADFIEATGTAKIAVLPTLIRREDRTAHSFTSQQQIVAFLNESGIGKAVTKSRRIDLGPLRRPSQWEIFQYGAESIATNLSGYETGADYTLVMELLVPDGQGIFGIEIYIMDRQGRSAFSFLLNSHHQMFSDAKLFAKDSSEDSRNKMIENATRVGLKALSMQIEQAREYVAARATSDSVTAKAGILHNFESKFASNTGRYDIPLGFSTFSDGNSRVSISRSDAHLPVPGETEGNTVMQLSLDVTGWAGVISRSRDDEANTWTSQDWSRLDGFSFWLYGNKSATEMFVDVLDNRPPYSRKDDAERYTYVFLDDVAGWRLISVRFTDMTRKEIGNDAPNDGLSLAEVHGWGLGTLNTSGPRVYYIDDFSLWRDPTGDQPQTDNSISRRSFVETPIDERSSRITVDTRSGGALVIEKVMSLMCDCAQLTIDRGFRYFVIDEQARLSGDRGSSRVTFYMALPEGIPVAPQETNLTAAAIDAEEFIKICGLMESQSQTRGRP